MFASHNTGTSHWLDPRLSKFQKKSLEECLDDELPYGWEKIEDPHYGTYYIDHVNRRTQYENPVLLAKRGAQNSDQSDRYNEENHANYATYGNPGDENSMQQNNVEHYKNSSDAKFDYEEHFFTRNPNKLKGERLTTVLIKSSRGLGFTIVGGDENVEEFLQIKSVVPNGPAWLDGKLKTGDVLVYVNETCVLGFTHHDMVSVFQSISPGETVKLDVCRGYPLPFDPNDPNTEVVTTIAVSAHDSVAGDTDGYLDDEMPGKMPEGLFESSVDSNHVRSGSDDMLNSSVKSMPDLCATEKIKNMQRPNSTDVLLENPNRSAGEFFNDPPAIPEKPEFLSISIVKGPMGFGFTIADSAYGQKVKKILDRQRCKNLMEGDILVKINSANVRNMCHGEVVQVLKDCERNQEAMVTVQRGSGSPSKSRPRKNDFTLQAPGIGLYRSKTPTADLYSTQQKEIMPNRPKTPIVDTRGRSKTPVLNANWTGNDVKLNAYKLSPIAQDQMGIVDRLAKTNLFDNNLNQSSFQKSDSFSRENHVNYPKTDSVLRNSFKVNHVDGHMTSPNNADVDLSKNASVYSPQSGYYNGYSESGIEYSDEYGTHMRQAYYQDPMGDKSKEVIMSRYPPHLKVMSPAGSRIHPGATSYDCIETIVSLVRQETGFGFRIVGGTEEGSQVGGTVSIGHIVPGGAADLDGRLYTGDEILSVDGQSVVNTSHHHVVQLMGKAAINGAVTIGIRRRIPTHQEIQAGVCMPSVVYPYHVTVTRREDEGFGFVIISSLNRSGSTIGRIIKGSPAERCGQLHVGDHILAVNHIDIISLHHGDIVNLIKDSGFSVTLTIGPPFDDTSSNASQRDDAESGVDEDQYQMNRGFGYPGHPAGKDGSTVEDQYHAVELNRGSRGFGFSIRGGKEFQNMPLYVLQIAENGPAAVNDKLKIGDQLIEINGINTKNMTHAEAIEIIRKGGPTVRLLVRRVEKIGPPGPAVSLGGEY
ncbi:hypothetical protein RUM43_011964 [Polyplax serrata]|uniref:Membrane-associated guanylate kinase, WW and PDZ domain-containing protein 2 n=1 Tax=Polyplax serrata TaxID=468196 RepID=A0AAN8PK04_POLSC